MCKAELNNNFFNFLSLRKKHLLIFLKNLIFMDFLLTHTGVIDNETTAVTKRATERASGRSEDCRQCSARRNCFTPIKLFKEFNFHGLFINPYRCDWQRNDCCRQEGHRASIGEEWGLPAMLSKAKLFYTNCASIQNRPIFRFVQNPFWGNFFLLGDMNLKCIFELAGKIGKIHEVYLKNCLACVQQP
jgi:hypothetical protein